MHKKSSVSWAHHIYRHVPLCDIQAVLGFTLLGLLGTHTPCATSVNAPAWEIPVKSGSPPPGETTKHILMSLEANYPFIKKESKQEEWSGAPKSRVGAACPLLWGKMHTQHQLLLSATDEKLEDFTTAVWFSEQQGYAGPQYLTLPSDINKRQWDIYLLVKFGFWGQNVCKKPVTIHISCQTGKSKY